MKTTYKYFSGAFIVMLIVSLTSCYKTKDTYAEVTVLDSANAPVVGADVRLYYENTSIADSGRIDLPAVTNSSGIASFDLTSYFKAGQAGLAVLDIYVNGVVLGIIQIKEETTSKETVVIP